MAGSGMDAFLNSSHGLDCRYCHGGQTGVLLKAEAHVDLIPDPSALSVNRCADCHADKASRVAHSLHTTMRGYHTFFEARTGRTLDSDPQIRAKYDAQCNKCHATCGSCHISRPDQAGGGFIAGHNIRRLPEMSLQCTACHGSRVGDEYTGAHAGLRPDVHYVPNSLHCKQCHNSARIHGDGTAYADRYSVENPVACRQCHAVGSDNAYHAVHGADFQCQVCHSQDYKNCADCHAGVGTQQPSWLQFKIGRNPIPDKRAGEMVVLRHIPVSENTYDLWGVASPNFASLPTWKYATPHNVVRWTARTDTSGGQSCFAVCHQTPNTAAGWFLRQVDLDALPLSERQANAHLIVPPGAPPWP